MKLSVWKFNIMVLCIMLVFLIYVELDTGMNIQIAKFTDELNIKFLNATEEGD